MLVLAVTLVERVWVTATCELCLAQQNDELHRCSQACTSQQVFSHFFLNFLFLHCFLHFLHPFLHLPLTLSQFFILHFVWWSLRPLHLSSGGEGGGGEGGAAAHVALCRVALQLRGRSSRSRVARRLRSYAINRAVQSVAGRPGRRAKAPLPPLASRDDEETRSYSLHSIANPICSGGHRDPLQWAPRVCHDG